jgi:superfamily II DNA or RNA helicase
MEPYNARSAEELADYAEGSPVLDEPALVVLGRAGLPKHSFSWLQRVLPRSDATFREFLRSPTAFGIGATMLSGKRAFLQRCIDLILVGPPQSSADVGAALRSLVAQAELPDLEAWPIGLFFTDFSTEPLVLAELLDSPSSFSPWVAQEVERGLRRFVEQLRAARVRAQEPLLLPARLEGKPLGSFFETLLELRRPTLARLPRGVVTARWEMFTDGPDFMVQLNWGGEPLQVVFGPLETFAQTRLLRCECGAPTCVHQDHALDSLARAIAYNEPEVIGALERVLSPRWEALLSALELEPEAPEPIGALTVDLSEHALGLRFHARADAKGPGKQLRNTPTAYLSRLEGLDRRFAEAVVVANTAGGGRSSLMGDALLLLAGHPRVSWGKDRCLPCRVRAPDVQVAEQGARFGVKVTLGEEGLSREVLGFHSTRGMVFPRRTADGVTLFLVPPLVLRLLDGMRRHGAQLPREALPRLAKVLPRLEQVAKVSLPEELQGEELPAAAKPVVEVLAAPPGLTVSVRVEPLPGGALFTPGEGAPVSATFDGARRRHTQRDFARELEAARTVAQRLQLEPGGEDAFSTLVAPPDAQVEMLRRLSGVAASGTEVLWKSKAPRFTREATGRDLTLSVAKSKDWFNLQGTADIDGQRVSLAELLEAARERRRWVRLGEGEFAQMSEQLLAQLQPLALLSTKKDEPTLTLGTLPIIETLAAEVASFDAAPAFTKLLERLATAKERKYPVPKTVKATLRDYQREGFEWLSRLAEWGAGACLADDMGLGKTLQSLTLLASRVKAGPALVVAPSSVMHGWRTEAARFVPSLKVKLFHEGRELQGLKGGDVVVVSWSMLAREIDAFSQVRFATVVLDEAQAIKNGGTLRAKATQALQADFVMAVSGTPIENHLGELWSLFRTVMPSLLGSEESFRERFKEPTPERVRALATLVKPFILRRTKAQVATELPARTDLDVVVPLSPEERELYDDVRLTALSQLGEPSAKKRFEILAALMRLRLSACHPRLVDATWAGPTSKLTRLLELLKDLIASGHRALVFSQFTKHLALVQAALKEAGLRWSYLDGQTPVGERARRVEAFQAGEGGDVFLISLKAGGTGLNLTAADYVIHLDPWWNPAVEDQASDRAHRLGQQRPVTVYRLIAEGTIEQRILELHREKRELVDSLLEGADEAGKLSATQLVGLIRGAAPDALT